MTSHPILHTTRLVLRAPAPDDATPLARLADDLDILRMTSRMPHPYTLAAAELFLDRAAQADPEQEVTWVILDGSGPIGVLGFFTDDEPCPEVGYWLGRPAWGRGYATEALDAALVWNAARWRKPRLLARCFTDNSASERVLFKAGFERSGPPELRPSLARGGSALTQAYLRYTWPTQ